jgi:hypothetical protein
LLLIVVGLVCVFPLSFYFLILATLHHRPRPTIIPGVWDTAALFCGLSGFFLVGGTVLIGSLDQTIREYWLRGGTLREWRILHLQADRSAKVLWAAYLLGLSAILVRGIRSRRCVTVIYQLTPDELEALLHPILERLHQHAERRGAWWRIRSNAEESPARPKPDRFQPALKVDGSDAMRIALIRWHRVDASLREDLEAELRRAIRGVYRPPSPAGVWFLTATGVIFMATAMLLGMIFFRLEHT